MLALRILMCATGGVLLGFSFLVYEDEDRKIQSRVENYWIWLDERRVQSYGTENRLLARFSSRLGEMLDSIFGRRLFSVRAFISSTSSSVITAILLISLLDLILPNPLPRPVLAGILGLAVWEVVCVVTAIRKPWIGLLLWATPFLLLALYLGTARSRTGERAHDFTIFLGSLLACFVTDLFVIAASRVFLRFATQVRSAAKLILMGISGILVLVTVSVLPAVLALSNSVYPKLHPERRVYYRLAQSLALMNVSDLFFLLALLLVIGGLIAHHAFWPSVQRPLYALQRNGIISSRKSAASLGVLLIATGLGLTPILDGIKKMFGA